MFLLHLNETKVNRGEHIYLDSCKAAGLCMHLVKSYASDRVRHMRADFYNFKICENLPPDDVSVRQMTIKNAISLCWRTMIIMTRRASFVLPESNTGEGGIGAEYHP